jgi:tetratricopeptide (TPR) repeat protein/uncharacterized protein YjhX (UPF0386 family)
VSLSSTSLPKPKNWQDFETKTCTLIGCVLGDPHTQPNGRSGQPQNGVDIHGSRNGSLAVGVQCKKKLESRVTDSELRAEVKKALNFVPPLSEFILVTTAPRDQAIQTTARVITAELAKTPRPMHVSVWGWEDVEERANEYERAWNAFDPTFNPYAKKGFEALQVEIRGVQQAFDQFASQVRQPTFNPMGIAADESHENTPLHGKVSAYSAFIGDGDVHAALTQLKKVKTEEWATASRSERYRLLVAFASASLKLGDDSAAGTWLLDAYSECPEHKNAKKNRATAFLLKGQYKEAGDSAREILADDPTQSDAAGTLIQARAHDATTIDPLDGVPEELHETEPVLIGRIHFLRYKEDSRWFELAKASAEKNPTSRILKVLAAEATLDDLIHAERDVVIGAVARTVTREKVLDTVEILYREARNAVEKSYALLPSTAHNAAIALRLVDEVAKAIDVLDAALLQYPADNKLRLLRALFAYSEGDMQTVVDLLPAEGLEPEAASILAHALIATGKPDTALAVIDTADSGPSPGHIELGLLSARCQAYLARGESALAIATVRKQIAANPEDLNIRAVLARMYHATGDGNQAAEALDEALNLFDETTSLASRLLLSFEAQQLKKNDAIVKLLHGRIATDRDSEALQLLIAASINGRFWVAARETLNSVPQDIREKEWIQRAIVILALNTGDPETDQKIGAYLKRWPNDAQMILARMGTWQRNGRAGDIRRFFANMNLWNLVGPAESRVRVGALATQYGGAERGLPYGYSVLLDNWNTPKAHLAYQGMIFANDDIAKFMSPPDTVSENVVVTIRTDSGDRRYRFEQKGHAFFEDERLSLDSDLALIILGKMVGDQFILQDRIGAKPVELLSIKSVYLDAFHLSIEQFNERFPRASGLLKFTFDPAAPDPLQEMRAITQGRAEAGALILEQYRSKGLPLAVAASALGSDALDVWSGLPGTGTPFLVCHGRSEEREAALQIIQKHARQGCVLDAITLSVIRRLKVTQAVTSTCGKIFTTESVMHLLASRALEAKHDVGKKKGVLAWQNGRLAFEEYSDEVLRRIADEREAEWIWATANVPVISAIPKEDFSKDTRALVDLLGDGACDPAIAASGGGLLLLSEDMGYRDWAGAMFNLSTTWLQPVLMSARSEGNLPADEYQCAINELALSGHRYISLEPASLSIQARKNDFEMTDELSRLLGTVGGPLADLHANTSVVCTFIDSALTECMDDFKLARIVSRVLEAMTQGRLEDQRDIVNQIRKRIRTRNGWVAQHCLGWLVGHSIGMPYFNDLVDLQKRFI